MKRVNERGGLRQCLGSRLTDVRVRSKAEVGGDKGNVRFAPINRRAGCYLPTTAMIAPSMTWLYRPSFSRASVNQRTPMATHVAPIALM
jgi:hypothetical protein